LFTQLQLEHSMKIVTSRFFNPKRKHHILLGKAA